MKIKVIEQNLETDIKKFLDSKGAQEIISKATGDDKGYTIRFKITNESIDRDGETILEKGIDWGPFDKNPVFLIDHKYTVGSIAGKVIKREIKGTETYLTVVLAKGIPAGELVKRLHEQGMIKGVSIGFMPLQRDASDRSIITKSEALEASAVAIGSNREALMDEKNAKLFKEVSKNWDSKENEKAITTETVSAEQLRSGDVIAYRFMRTFMRDGVEVVEFYPNKKRLPSMGMIIQKLENDEEVLSWNGEALIATKEDPILTIQNHIKSEDEPKMRTTNVFVVKHSSLLIEKIVPKADVKKSLETLEKELNEDEIDIKTIFNMMKEMKEEISSLKAKPLSNDKEKEVNLEKSRELARQKAKKSGQDFQKHLSVLLNLEK